MNKSSAKVLKASSSNEWKKAKNKTVLLELPSGNVVEVKERLGIFECSTTGHIPLDLFNSVFDFGSKLVKNQSIAGISSEEVDKTLEVLRRVSCIAVINPKVVFERKEELSDSICAEDIPEEDLFAIFGAVMQVGGKKELRPFPEQ